MPGASKVAIMATIVFCICHTLHGQRGWLEGQYRQLFPLMNEEQEAADSSFTLWEQVHDLELQ